VTGSVFTNLHEGEIDQTQVRCWKVLEASELKFGLNYTKVGQPFGLLQQPARHLGRRHQAERLPKQRLASDDLRQYFDKIDGSNSS
jgi:hypothetical protein